MSAGHPAPLPGPGSVPGISCTGKGARPWPARLKAARGGFSFISTVTRDVKASPTVTLAGKSETRGSPGWSPRILCVPSGSPQLLPVHAMLSASFFSINLCILPGTTQLSPAMTGKCPAPPARSRTRSFGETRTPRKAAGSKNCPPSSPSCPPPPPGMRAAKWRGTRTSQGMSQVGSSALVLLRTAPVH